MIFNRKMPGKCLRNDEEVLEGARGPAIVLHSDVKWHGVSRSVELQKHESMDFKHNF